MSAQLVTLHGRNATTTSVVVAEVFEKNHQHVMEAIRKIDCPESFSLSNFRPRNYIDVRGKTQPMFEITRDGFSFLAMGFTGKKAALFKIQFIEAFNKMHSLLMQKNDPQWQGIRESGTIFRRMLTDVIQEFIEYARKQDSKHADQYFSNYTRMIYRSLEIDPPKVSKGVARDFMDVLELSVISSAEMVCVGVIKGGMNTGKHYKEIFQDAKAAVCNYALTINPARQLANATKTIALERSTQ